MGGLLKESEERIIASKDLFVDVNALVPTCLWRASGGELEGEAFLRDLETLKEAIYKMKESYMNMLSDRNHLLEMTNIYHHALRKEEDEVESIGSELEATYGSLESTQRALQESKL